jgi:hypothetical protein
VYGHDHKVSSNGEAIEQGHGSKGHESVNHFASILRYEGREAYDKAVAEIHARDPKRHAALRLPLPRKAG